MGTNMENKERHFSIELKSKADLKNIMMTNGSQDSVLIEGTIGRLLQGVFVEDIILQITGEKGTLRINVEQRELKRETLASRTSENLYAVCPCKSVKPQIESKEVNKCK